MAGSNDMKKLGVVAVVGLFILLFVSIVALYMWLGAPLVLVAVVCIVYVIVAAVLLYHARARFKEIEEGLDDAVDNY
ncbi:MAG: hypothetical protein IKD00_07390 [Candidatus Methanomethylophilaceae archaeon]|jgi:Flp pilus assembly protein TadB|nr:hypothetical protein [Candidatus Methanomethylophilaceae archaeon]